MSSDSLLRPLEFEFFNTWIAVSYLFKYSYNDDVIHYSCNALKDLPLMELEYFLPQLIHLLLSKPTLTAVLEDTLADLWKRSPHLAMMSIWQLQTYLLDWSSERTSPNYLLCLRMLDQCQSTLQRNITAQDNLGKGTVRQPQRQQTSSSSLWKTESGQQRFLGYNPGTAIIQEHHDNNSLDQKMVNNNIAGNDPLITDSNNSSSSNNCNIDDTASFHSTEPPHQYQHESLMITSSIHSLSFATSLTSPPAVDPFSLSRYLPSHMKWLHHKPFQHMRRAVSSDGILANELSSISRKPSVIGTSAVPLLNSTNNSIINNSSRYNHLRHSLSSSYLSTIYTLRQQQDPISNYQDSLPDLEPSSTLSTASSTHSPRPSSPISLIDSGSSYKMQRSDSCGLDYQMKFVATLADIAERLVALPKSYRGNTLHAELTLLNHHLAKVNVCIPLWCSGDCSSVHHRVVRLSPSDAVVLNSAERAPYVLMVEVLDDDMCLEWSAIKATHGDEMLVTSEHATMATSPKAEQAKMMIDAIPSTDFSQQMRTAAVLLAQLQQQNANDPTQAMVHAIRQRVVDQVVALEERRILLSSSSSSTATRKEATKQLRTNACQSNKKRRQGGDGDSSNNLHALTKHSPTIVANKDDPSAAILSESWQMKTARIRKNSPFGHLLNWRLLSVIVKQGTDLRQEQFTLQLIRELQKIWQHAGVDAWVEYYRVLVTSENSGLIETIRNTVSIHSIKKNAHANNQHGSDYTLRDFFQQRWGPTKSTKFKAAQAAFLKSLAGYSIACYLLQIKDRHNGNLLLDDQGHLIHIDFGFVLSTSPGSVGFEKAPFKLSQEFIDVLDGVNSELFVQYRCLMKQAFKALRKHGDTILLLVEMMSKHSNLPCFKNNPDHVVLQLKERFQFHMTDRQLDMFVDKLISKSRGSMFTRLYDTYQYYSQGIL